MQLRRGLLRLWTVASVVWIAFVAYEAHSHISSFPDPEAVRASQRQIEAGLERATPCIDPTRPRPDYCPTLGEANADFDRLLNRQRINRIELDNPAPTFLEATKFFTLAALGPPLAVILVSFTVGWIIRGFRA